MLQSKFCAPPPPPPPPPTYNFYTFYDVRTYIYINLALRRVTVLTYAFMH